MKRQKSKILKEIAETYIARVKNTEVSHKRLMLLFSGIPCTDKTYLAKKIEKRYHGIRLNSDEARKVIKKLGRQKYPELLNEKYKEEVLRYCLHQWITKYPFKNRLFILDKGIDRDFEDISRLAKKAKFKIFLIRITSTKENAEKGAMLKLGKPDRNFIENIDRWVREYKKFGKTHKADITIKNSLSKPINTTILFQRLDKTVK